MKAPFKRGFFILFIFTKNRPMSFRATFCDPFKEDVIELGAIDAGSIIEKFEKIPWTDFLLKMSYSPASEIYYSPSLEVENTISGHALSISAVGEPGNFEFYIFYKRPKKIKYLFGMKEKTDENYLTDITGQKKQDVIQCLTALIKNDEKFLADKIGE